MEKREREKKNEKIRRNEMNFSDDESHGKSFRVSGG